MAILEVQRPVLVGHGLRKAWGLVRQLPTIPTLILSLVIIGAVFAGQLAPHRPTEAELRMRTKPAVWVEGGSTTHLLGTDDQGRDILSRIIHGSRISLAVSLAAVLLAGTIGTAIGLLAGYKGGLLDALLMRLADIGLSMPLILIAVVVAAVAGPSFRNVILVIGFLLWPRFARQIRGETLSIKENDYIALARVAGRSGPYIVWRHVFPNVVPTLLVISTLQMAYVILLEGSLSFLGVGVPPPNPAWGLMIAEGRHLVWTAPWVAAFPGIAMAVTLMALNMFGDWLRDKLDPKLRQV
ncbi:MAG: ABC transporter permease [Candidatus Methylomirabilales bacterium]